jgi:DNA-binding HxlR family transcriptional regulator
MEDYLKYTEGFPKKSRMAINALGGQNGKRYAIVTLLMDKKSLSYNEIKSKLNLASQSLSNALDDLQRGGVVEKRVGEKIGDQSTGNYTITSYGERLIQNIQFADPTVQSNFVFSTIEYTADEFSHKSGISDIIESKGVVHHLLESDSFFNHESEQTANTAADIDYEPEQATAMPEKFNKTSEPAAASPNRPERGGV